jgi:hypothetical protein
MRLIGLLFLSSALFACSKTAHSPSALDPLTVDQVAAGDKIFVYDDNSKDTWAEGHVPGAKWLDEDHVTAGDLPSDKTAYLVFYCHSES